MKKYLQGSSQVPHSFCSFAVIVAAFQKGQELLDESGFAVGEKVDPIAYLFTQLEVMVSH